MHVTRGHYRLVKHLADLDYLSVYILEILCALYILKAILPDHELVVPVRLDLKIVIERCDPEELIVALSVEYSLIEFALFAGGSDQETLTVFSYKALRYLGLVMEVPAVRKGDESVQIDPSGLICCEQDNMVRIHLADLLVGRCGKLIESRKRRHTFIRKPLQEFFEHMCRRFRVIDRAVVIFKGHLEELAQPVKIELRDLRNEYP